MSARDESSLGDLVRVLAALRPTDREATMAITRLVLGPLAGKDPATARAPVPTTTVAPIRAEPTSVASTPEPPAAIEPWVVMEESQDELLALGRAPAYEDTPVWFSAPLPDDPAPARPRLDPLFEPLWSRNLTSAFAATWAPDGDVDVPRVVATLSRGRAVTVLPRLLRLTTRRGVQLLVDRSDAMMPFGDDVDPLIDALRRVVGHENARVVDFEGCPLSDEDAVGEWATYVPPPAETPVVVLSDLGLSRVRPGADLPDADRWRAFFRAVRRAQCPCVMVTPFGPSRWPAWLKRYARVLHWHRTTHPSHARPPRRAARHRSER
jgi:hypothetical protein